MRKYRHPGTRQYVKHYLSNSGYDIVGYCYSITGAIPMGIKKTYNIILN